MSSLLLTGCAELVTLAGPVPRRGEALGEAGIIRDGAVLIRDGVIAAAGKRRAIERLKAARMAREIDLEGRVALPGFVDSHTHLVFPGSRASEYEMRISGATYQEIAKAGGGILSSARELRKMPAGKLESQSRGWLKEFAAHGTTTIEAKSGYGLDWPSERKILRVQANLAQIEPLELVSTFLGAHVVPAEFRGKPKGPEKFAELVASQWVPRVAREGLAEFCDVFCDQGAFTVEQSRKILKAARVCGLGLRIHAEQLTRTGAGMLAVELHAASADHLDKLDAKDIAVLGKSEVTCTLLPGCSFHLGLREYAPARGLIKAGAIVGLATDFNPGTCATMSMPMILSLACTQMGMLPAEAIAAATINAAYSLRRHERIGSIEPGKDADLAVFNLASYREIPYYFGVNHCCLAMKRGRIIHSTLEAARQIQ